MANSPVLIILMLLSLCCISCSNYNIINSFKEHYEDKNNKIKLNNYLNTTSSSALFMIFLIVSVLALNNSN